MPASMTVIAKEAGGSRPLVSRLLNNDSTLRAGNETKERIKALNHLKELGHRRISYLSPQRSHYPAFLSAMFELGFKCMDDYNCPYDTPLNKKSPEDYRAASSVAFGKWIDGGGKATAIICHNDFGALGAIDAMRERGMTPGKEISLIGFDNVNNIEETSMKAARRKLCIFTAYINKVGLAFIIAAFILVGNVNAANYTVTNSADSGAGTLRDIVANDVSDGDTVGFDAGVTYITLTSGRININDSIHIMGPGPENLTIDGNANDRGFYMAQGGLTSIISGITITNCAITGTTTAGGGIFLGTTDTMHLTVSNCVISGCTAEYRGGGMGLLGGKAVVIDTTISGCSATTSGGDGGAIYNTTDFGLYISGCIISKNTAGDEGGGIYSTKKLVADNCTFSENTASDTGGGLSFSSANTSTSTISRCVISNNTSSADGGGVRIYNSHVDISNCVITVNSAGDDGGGIYFAAANNERDSCIWNTIFSNNTSHDFGGAIQIDDQNIWIYNSTFSDNAATNGSDSDGGAINQTGGESFLFIDSSTFYRNHAADDGGALCLKDPAELRNCTISGNISDDQGGGVYVYGSGTETQKIYNCTIYSNTCATLAEGGGIYRSTSVLEIYSSIIVSNVVGRDIQGAPAIMNYCLYNTRSATPGSEIGNITGDPQLEALADNGGPTLTHALIKGSIAIDAGSNPLALLYDQRGSGYPREEPGGNPDIGAYEFNAGAPKGTVVTVK